VGYGALEEAGERQAGVTRATGIASCHFVGRRKAIHGGCGKSFRFFTPAETQLSNPRCRLTRLGRRSRSGCSAPSEFTIRGAATRAMGANALRG
jgi:hypothetical protein